MNQTRKILRHLELYGSITSLEAVQEYGIMRLASRISDLKKAGVAIRVEMVSGKNRFGEATSYAKYSLGVEEVGRWQNERKEQHGSNVF